MSGRIPDSVINEISSKVNIQDVVGQYVSLSNRGGRLLGLCPFHTERTPSFSVSPDKNAFYCFGCGKGGGLFQFVMEIEKVTFVEAVKILAEKAGVEISEEAGQAPDRKMKDAKKELYTRMASSFHHILFHTTGGQKARTYVESRGINPDICDRFMIGFAPSDPQWMYRFLVERNYSADFLSESGLFSRKRIDYPLFCNRLMFPIFNTGGQVVGFSGRDMGDRGPKYINSPDSDIYHKGSLLYGFFQASASIRKKKEVILCEGNVDVLALHQSGLDHAVAPLGTAFTEDQARLLKRYADKVVIAFDSDNAGKKATERSGMICERTGLDVLVAEFPSGMDPAELLQKEGAEILKNWVLGAVNFFDFLLKYKFESNEGNSDRLHSVVSDLSVYIDSVASVVRRDQLLEQTADYLGLDRVSVRQDFHNRDKSANVSKKASASSGSGDSISQEMYLLLCVIQRREALSEVLASFDPEDFEDTRAQSLFEALIQTEKDGIQDLDLILQSVEDKELREVLLRKIQSGEFRINTDTVVAESIRSIRYRKLERKSRKLDALISQMERQGSGIGTIQELIIEKKLVDSEILKVKDVRR